MDGPIEIQMPPREEALRLGPQKLYYSMILPDLPNSLLSQLMKTAAYAVDRDLYRTLSTHTRLVVFLQFSKHFLVCKIKFSQKKATRDTILGSLNSTDNSSCKNMSSKFFESVSSHPSMPQKPMMQ